MQVLRLIIIRGKNLSMVKVTGENHSIEIGLSVRACVCPSHFKSFFHHNRWANFDETWRVAGYTMQNYKSQKSGPQVTCIII